MAELLFSDLPDAKRMAYREAVDAAGGDVAGYNGPDLQVAIPRPSGPFFAAMKAAGLKLVEESLHHFPLGSDCPPDHLRHAVSKYGPERGFWLFARFAPMQ